MENKTAEIVKKACDYSFVSLLAVAFIVLKLCGVIDWAWIWVLAPVWIPFALVLAIIVVMFVVAFIITIVNRISDRA